jgi:glutaredoxin-related protein
MGDVLKFSDLQNLNFLELETESSINRLQSEYGIDAPKSVIEQFYIDHSNNFQFQELYGLIDLNLIEWQLVEVPIKKMLNLGRSATHPDFILEVSEDVSYYDEVGDSAIDCREDVIEHWKHYGTWTTPPIFIKGELLGKPEIELHLVEGHTRVGCLCGLTNHQVMRVAKVHEVYLGKLKSIT